MNKPIPDASAAAGSTLAAGSALNTRQLLALASFGSEWKRAPLRTASATLLSLQRRGLIECRIAPGAMPHLDGCAAYNGYAFQWRKPNGQQ